MKKLLVLCVMMIVCLIAISQRNVLFVGNSMTFYNDMPKMFEKLANTKEQNLKVTQFTIGGAGLNNLKDEEELLNLFNQSWDYVILQPGTSESAGQGVGVDSLTSIIKQMCRKIWTTSPCAKIFLYEISNGIYLQNGVEWWDYYFSTQPIINNTIHRVAQNTKLPYVPVGECFVAYYKNRNDLKLHISFNDVHPNANGSYLTALAMYNALFEESSNCSYYGNTEEELAKLLQHISDSIVLSNKSLWLLDDFKTNIDFSYVIDSNIVKFQNLSMNYDDVKWNINDEFVSYDDEFEYKFNGVGEKFATMTIENHGCRYELTKTFTIQYSSAINDIKINDNTINIRIKDDVIILEANNDKDLNYKITNLLGQTIQYDKTVNHTIDIHNIERGEYILTLIQNNKSYSYKFIK